MDVRVRRGALAGVGSEAAVEAVLASVVGGSDQAVVPGAAGDRVDAEAAVEGVVPGATGEGVVAVTAVDRVVEVRARDGVVSTVAVDRLAGVRPTS